MINLHGQKFSSFDVDKSTWTKSNLLIFFFENTNHILSHQIMNSFGKVFDPYTLIHNLNIDINY